MAVTNNNAGQSGGALSATSLTIAGFVVGAGSNRCIYLGVSQWKAADTQPTAVFNGSENFVVHDSVTIVEGGGVRRVTLFKLVNPTVTTANIVVTWASAVDEAVAGASAWNGVDQTTPFSAAVKASGSGAVSSSINITGAVGDVTHDVISADAAVAAGATPNQTQRWRAIAGASTTEGAGQSAAGTAGAVAHTWTTLNSGSTAFFAHIGVAIQQSASGITLTGSPAVSTWVARDGALSLSAVSLTGPPGIATWTARDGTLSLGAVALTGPPAIATWTARDGSLSLGAVSLTGAPGISTWVARDGALQNGTTLTGGPAVSAWTTPDGTLTLGLVSLTGVPAVSAWVARDATLVDESAPAAPPGAGRSTRKREREIRGGLLHALRAEQAAAAESEIVEQAIEQVEARPTKKTKRAQKAVLAAAAAFDDSEDEAILLKYLERF